MIRLQNEVDESEGTVVMKNDQKSKAHDQDMKCN